MSDKLLLNGSRIPNYKSIKVGEPPKFDDQDLVPLNKVYLYLDFQGRVQCMAPKNMPTTVSDGVYEFPYRKPDEVSRLKALKDGIYNHEQGTLFGRTASSWGGIITFYVLFFSALAAMFSICMYGLLSTLDSESPTYQLDSSLIGANPGMGYRPYADDLDEKGSLIWYQAGNPNNTKIWTSALDRFLKDYSSANREVKGFENRVLCSSDQPAPPGKVCDVQLTTFGPCTPENGYSYNKSSPCIFIKLNRIFGWKPDYYNDPANLPKEMDESLKAVITAEEEKNVIWVSCYGENVADRENIGELAYYPKQGFSGYYYPFTNTPGYLSPLVAVHLKRPKPNTLINIECRAWAKNIQYARARMHREGSVHIEVQVD